MVSCAVQKYERMKGGVKGQDEHDSLPQLFAEGLSQ